MLLRSATRVHGVRCEREGSIRVVMSDRWRMSPGLRRTSAVVAIVALAIGGAKIASDHTMPGSGFSTVATVAADPTGGPTGGPGGPGGMNGSQFQPPGLPPQMPDYQGGMNQPRWIKTAEFPSTTRDRLVHNRFRDSKADSSLNKHNSPRTAHKSRTTRPTPDTPKAPASRTPTIKHRNSRPRSRANNPSSSRDSSSRARPPHRLSSRARPPHNPSSPSSRRKSKTTTRSQCNSAS